MIFCPAACHGETIILKSGKTVEGKITKRTDKYIELDKGGLILPYYLEEIERIDTNNVPDGTHRLDSEYSATLLSMGIRFTPPDRWTESATKNGWHYQRPTAIIFTSPDKISRIYIGYPKTGISTAIYDMALSLRHSLKHIPEQKIVFKNAISRVWEENTYDKKKKKIKQKTYLFMKDKIMYEIIYSAEDYFYYKYLDDFEKALNSFEPIQ